MRPWGELALLLLLAALLIGIAVWIVTRIRRTPMERERRRRVTVNKTGRLGEGIITDVLDDSIYYSYMIRGVQYAAAQDVSKLRAYLPPEVERMVGPVTLKYSPNNPANSILVCEEWTGVRARTQPDAKTA